MFKNYNLPNSNSHLHSCGSFSVPNTSFTKPTISLYLWQCWFVEERLMIIFEDASLEITKDIDIATLLLPVPKSTSVFFLKQKSLLAVSKPSRNISL